MSYYDNVQDFIQCLRARPCRMWLNSPAIQAGSQPGSRYMPVCSYPPAALRHCSARKSGQMVLTQTYHNNPYHPHLEFYCVLKLPRFYASHHCVPTHLQWLTCIVDQQLTQSVHLMNTPRYHRCKYNDELICIHRSTGLTSSWFYRPFVG